MKQLKQNWEKRFDEIYNDDKTNIVMDLRLKDFIKDLLKEQREEVITQETVRRKEEKCIVAEKNQEFIKDWVIKEIEGMKIEIIEDDEGFERSTRKDLTDQILSLLTKRIEEISEKRGKEEYAEDGRLIASSHKLYKMGFNRCRNEIKNLIKK